MSIKMIFFISIVLGVILAFSIISLINNLSKYFKWKTNKVREDFINDSFVSTNNLLDLIGNVIRLEVLKQIESLNVINQPYNVLNLDKDVELISEKVYRSLKKEILLDYSLVTKEYISLFIIETTKTLLITEIKQMRENVYPVE